MHTYESRGTVFHFNSDWSGNLLIADKGREHVIEVPAKAVLELVAEKYVKPRLIAEIENEDWEELLV